VRSRTAPFPIVPVLLAALFLLSGPALADRQAAQFFSGRGDKALQTKDFAGAEEHFRKALEEDGTFRPARYGLAQALVGLGRPADAVAELKAFVAEMRAEPAPPVEWRALLAKAEKQFADMDAGSAEIRRIVDRYADELVALARKWAEKDPGTAERAAKRALQLRPGDARAAEILQKVADVPKGAPVALFNGADLKNWEGELDGYRVADGVIVGDGSAGARVIRSRAAFSEDYDVRIEAKLVEESKGQDAILALLGCYKGEADFNGLGVINRKIYSYDRTSSKDRRILVKTPVAEWKADFDPEQWNVYEFQFRGDEITAVVAGELVGKDVRGDHRRDGFVGLFVQGARVQIRKVEVQVR
jgi:tetratricopeptide (TPR) repeat protein